MEGLLFCSFFLAQTFLANFHNALYTTRADVAWAEVPKYVHLLKLCYSPVTVENAILFVHLVFLRYAVKWKLDAEAASSDEMSTDDCITKNAF